MNVTEKSCEMYSTWEDLLGVNNLEESREEIGRPHRHQRLVLKLHLRPVGDVALQIYIATVNQQRISFDRFLKPIAERPTFSLHIFKVKDLRKDL
jgi:hypothetical protein